MTHLVLMLGVSWSVILMSRVPSHMDEALAYCWCLLTCLLHLLIRL